MDRGATFNFRGLWLLSDVLQDLRDCLVLTRNSIEKVKKISLCVRSDSDVYVKPSGFVADIPQYDFAVRMVYD